MTRKIRIVLSIIAVIALLITPAIDATENLNRSVLSNGATDASAPNIRLQATLGEFTAGSGTFGPAQDVLITGFWQQFGSGPCCNLRGDTDFSGDHNVSDAATIVAYLFQSGPMTDCYELIDTDGSRSVNVVDITYLIAFLFRGGPQPTFCQFPAKSLAGN